MNRLILFAKAPVPGRVKTRLCPPLSPEQAAGLYVAFARDSFELLDGVEKASVEIAYEPSRLFTDPAWISRRARWFPQKGRDLGARMAHAFERAFAAGASRVVIVGSDSPGLPARRFGEAFASLKSRDCVLGPSRDGGYYLIGLRRACPALFRGIRWSTDEVFAKTVALARAQGLTLRRLPSFGDVDRPEDLPVLRRTLAKSHAGWPRSRQALWLCAGRAV